jgi:GT2 family glycosyltransferase
MKTLAVIMPRFANNKETHELTETCISALLHHIDERFITSLTVVDDGSRIPPVKRAGVSYIQHESNRGIACGWNTGWRANRDADFLCWINADCEVTANWAFPLVAAVEQMDIIAMPFTNNEKAHGNGIAGWCFLTRQDLANKIGPFDESFVPAQYEDTDWFHRAIYYHKIPIANVTSSNVLHTGKRGGTADVQRFNLLHMANRYRYAWKHGTNPADSPPFWKNPIPDILIEETNGDNR